MKYAYYLPSLRCGVCASAMLMTTPSEYERHKYVASCRMLACPEKDVEYEVYALPVQLHKID
jgi:hypothetical protein